MFRGINSINIDTKGRIAIPVRYRQELVDEYNGQIILTIDTEQTCLLLYPMPVWMEIEKKISQLPSFHPATRRIQRLLIGHATDIDLDCNGRVLVPALLREYAHLDKNAVLVGQGNKLELWDEKIWQDSREKWLADGLTLDGENIPEELKTISL